MRIFLVYIILKMTQSIVMFILLSTLATLSSAYYIEPGSSPALPSISSYQGQHTTVSAYILEGIQDYIYASVISADATVTAYQLECPPDHDCEILPSANLTISDSTIFEFTYTDGAFTESDKCTVISKSAVCQESFGGSDANFPGSSVETIDPESVTVFPITVTGGLDKLASATSTSASSGAKSSSSGAKQTASATAGNSTAAHNAAGKPRTSSWMLLMLVTTATVFAFL
jgi:hypothetical protein